MRNTSTDVAILPRSRSGVARRSRSFATALCALTLVASCGGDDATGASTGDVAGDEAATAVTADRPAFGLVTPQQAATLAEDPGVTVIDVRTPEEFAEGHIDGAIMIDFESASFADDVAALDPAGNYLVYCRSGNRSGQAVAQMQELGLDQIWDLDGGTTAWTAAGLPLGA